MTVGVQEHSGAFAVRFRALDLWSVGSQLTVKWGWPSESIRSLGDVLSRRIEPLGKDFPGDQPIHLLTIRFDGSIEPRPLILRNKIKGRLFRVYSRDVVFSKIDVRNGAIGLVPVGIENAVVTSEFPTYSVRLEFADPQYIKLLFRTKVFMRILNSMISGTSGRKRIQPTQLENVVVPLPTLPVQQAIAAFLHESQDIIDITKKRVSQMEQKMAGQFISVLGLTLPKPVECLKVFAAHWKEFDRWSVSYNQTRQSVIDLASGKYPVVDLGSVLETVQYGTSDKANNHEEGIPIIRMNNIIGGELDLSDLKYIRLPRKNENSLLLKYGDILFNRTNSKELVGKCAVFRENGDYVFASYLMRLRANKAKAIPEYLSFVINSQIGRGQINALSRQIIGQANINSQELRSLQIPLPPLEIQNEIMNWVSEGRAKIVNERKVSECLRLKTEREIEEMILGIRQVERQ